MSGRNGGYFKDLGNFGHQFLNQVANELRSNVEQVVGGAFTSDPTATTSGPSSRPEARSSSSASTPSGRGPHPSQGQRSNSTSSSQATTPDDVGNDWFHQFVRSGGSSSGFNSSMGNGGLCGSRNSVNPASGDQDSAMVCDICQVKYTLFNRKKLCSECKDHFCGSCVTREAPSGRRGHTLIARTCTRCKILLSNPLIRADLMELRVKDLQRYLVSKKVNTKSCVEKKDLVELVMRQNAPPAAEAAASADATGTGSTSEASGSQPRRKVPEERKKSFPNSYVQSTHRHEWLEKLESGQDEIPLNCEDDDDDDFVVVTPVQPLDQPTASDQVNSGPVAEGDNEDQQPRVIVAEEASVNTPVEPIDAHDDDDDDSVVGAAEAVPEEEASEAKFEKSEEEHIDPPPDSSLENSGGAATSEPIRLVPTIPMPNATATPLGSPRRFANQGLVYLSEIETLDDVQELSVKQAKDILAMNRVNFKGVVEKDELLKYVTRLWKQDQQSQTEKDTMNDTELCKICMDNPVDCVMLECGHMCTCTTCGKQMAECPICRQYVVRVVRTFKA